MVIAVVASGSLLYSDVAISYNMTPDTSAFAAVSNKSIELNKIQTDMQDRLSQNTGQGDIVNDLIYGANMALKTLMTAVGSVGGIFTAIIIELGDYAGYPVLTAAIISILGFLFILGIIYLIARILKG